MEVQVWRYECGNVSAVAGSYPISFIRANRVPGTVVGAGDTKRKPQRQILCNVVNRLAVLWAFSESAGQVGELGRDTVGIGRGATAEAGPEGGELDAQGASQRQRCEAANAGRWAGRTRPQRALGRGGAPTFNPRRPLQVAGGDTLVASAFLSSLFPPSSGHIFFVVVAVSESSTSPPLPGLACHCLHGKTANKVFPLLALRLPASPQVPRDPAARLPWRRRLKTRLP